MDFDPSCLLSMSKDSRYARNTECGYKANATRWKDGMATLNQSKFRSFQCDRMEKMEENAIDLDHGVLLSEPRHCLFEKNIL